MTRVGSWAGVAVAGLALAPWGQGRAEAPAVRAEPARLSEAEGRIVAVDAVAGTLTLASARGPLVVRVDSGTTIFLGGRVGQLGELAPGQAVRAAFEPADGAPGTAAWIELAPEAAGGSPREAQGAQP